MNKEDELKKKYRRCFNCDKLIEVTDDEDEVADAIICKECLPDD